MQIVSRIVCAFVAAVAVLLSAAPRAAFAQKPVEIKLHCKVAGYSDWVRIDPGCNSGGKVIRESGGGLVTDRVQRVEMLRVSIDDKSFTRKCSCTFDLLARVGTKKVTFFKGDITIPFKREETVTRDPNLDNIEITVFDPIAPGGKVTRRIPIGTR